MKKYTPGVLFGDELAALYQDAKDNGFALPAVNTIGTNSINATLEAAAKVNSPVIIQFSNGGAQFIAGKSMPNDNLQANIAGAISGALHVHNVAKYYGVPVVLHTDHAAKNWLPWISGLIDAGTEYHKRNGVPLFSSHMLDLSEESLEENIETSVEFFKRMAPLGMGIEIELGVTGGEEDGVDNSGVRVLQVGGHSAGASDKLSAEKLYGGQGPVRSRPLERGLRRLRRETTLPSRGYRGPTPSTSSPRRGGSSPLMPPS